MNGMENNHGGCADDRGADEAPAWAVPKRVAGAVVGCQLSFAFFEIDVAVDIFFSLGFDGPNVSISRSLTDVLLRDGAVGSTAIVTGPAQGNRIIKATQNTGRAIIIGPAWTPAGVATPVTR